MSAKQRAQQLHEQLALRQILDQGLLQGIR